MDDETFHYYLDDYSDRFKEVNGIRPSLNGLENWTVENFNSAFSRLKAEAEVKAKTQQVYEFRAIVALENRIRDLIKAGAGDRETAISWIFDSEGITNKDYEYLCFLLGVPYGYLTKEAVAV